jgi:quinol monooxygenase YgiN
VKVNRRKFMVSLAALAAGGAATQADAMSSGAEGKGMFGLIVKMMTVPGKRDALAKILIEGTAAMPGCLSYIVSKDLTDENAIWISEVWDSRESHDASLSLSAVKSAIAAGRPMISGVGMNVITEPLGGYGLAVSKG